MKNGFGIKQMFCTHFLDIVGTKIRCFIFFFKWLEPEKKLEMGNIGFYHMLQMWTLIH